MTLKQLEAFYWAATCSNFAIAAKRSNLSVSSLSKRISELETSLGSLLFDRSGHRATLTDSGRDLLPRARHLLQEADTLRQSMALTPGVRGNCRFGAGELAALTWVPSFIRRLQHTYPALSIEAEVGVGSPLEDKVERGELDFILIAGPSSRPRLASVTLAEIDFSWVFPKAAGQARSCSAQQAFDSHTLISLPSSSGVVRILDAWLAKNELAIGKRLVCNSWGAVASFIDKGIGFGFLPTPWAKRIATQGNAKIQKTWPSLDPLTFTYQWRRDDARLLVQEAQRLALECVQFNLAP
jgi:DNA-binding transcriptional LysR family regulator